MFRAACIQFCASRTVEENIATVSRLVRAAVSDGAELVMTPEMSGLIEMDGRQLLANTHFPENDPALQAFQLLAAELSCWLLIGSLAVRVSEDRLANRSYLIRPDGVIAAQCDKIHMFDVSLPDGETYRESNRYVPGTEAVVADLPWGRIGLTVCYDLRFPDLYRTLARAGASFLTVPSAFTVPTGRAHWHVLLRARAIETGSFVFAPAQEGEHEAGRKTFGHSIIIDPWGKVLAEVESGEGVIFADIDPKESILARDRIPALLHDRPFDILSRDVGSDGRRLAS